MFRVLIVTLLINGLVPQLTEGVETVAHRITAGHLAHAAGDRDLGELGAEHGCGTTMHLCLCCASADMTPVARAEYPRPQLTVGRPSGARSDLHGVDPRKLLFRPPINA